MLQSAGTAILQRSKAKQLHAPCEAQSAWCIQDPKRQKIKGNHRLLQPDLNLNIQPQHCMDDEAESQGDAVTLL